MNNKGNNLKTKSQIKNNNNDLDINSSSNKENELINLIEIIIKNLNFEENYNSDINDLKYIFKYHLKSKYFLNLFFNKLKHYINSSSIDILQKKNILSLIIIIIEIEPNKFYQYIEMILEIFQYFFKEEFSQIFPLISQNFGDLIKLELSSLNNISYQNQTINNEKIMIVYNKYKSFCLNNIKSNSIYCRICGTFCLTTFIENCSFIYDNNDKLKELFDILINQIDNPKETGKLAILNCLTSLIIYSERQYIPFAKLTVKKIIDYCTNQEWIIRKFALNIICTLMYCCQEEILSLKDIIMSKLKYLNNETSPEIKELYDLISNSFIEADKNDNDNKLSEINDLNTEEISLEKNIDKNFSKKYIENKNDKIFDFVLLDKDEHLITEINYDENKKINDNNNSNNNIKNYIISPYIPKKCNSRIINNTDIKKESKISRSKSLGQKNILKLKWGENKNKIKEDKIYNAIEKILPYNNVYKTVGNNNKNKCLDSKNISKNKNNSKNNNKTINNTKISVNNKFYFIKNYSLMFKSNRIKKENKYNKSFSIKDKTSFFGNNNKNTIIREKELNNINIPKNANNEYATIINNSALNRSRKITPQQNINNKLRKNKILGPIKILEEKITKTNVSNNNISSKLLMNINSDINKKIDRNKNNSENNNKINKNSKKNKSADKCNKNLNKNESQKNSLYKNYLSRNTLNSLKGSSKSKKEKKGDHSFNPKNIKNRKNMKLPEYNNFITCENKSNRIEIINTTKRTPYISKKEKQFTQNSTLMDGYPLKKRNYLKIVKKYIHNNNSNNNNNKSTKEKLKNNNISPIKDLLSTQYENNTTYNSKIKNEKEKEKEIKLIKNKSIKSKNKKINPQLYKNNSISITNKNNINKELNINIIENDNNKSQIQNTFSFQKNIENKQKLKQKDNKRIFNKKINTVNRKISDSRLLNEFNLYKQSTNKIIFDLKNKVEELEKTIYIYKNKQKNNEKIKELIKNKKFIDAFNLAINLNQINEIYYIIKAYNFYYDEDKINNCKLQSELLSKIIDIIFNDIISFENISIVLSFIKNNIIDQKIKIKKQSSILLYNTLVNLYNKKNEFFFSLLDIDNIKCLIDYFNNN